MSGERFDDDYPDDAPVDRGGTMVARKNPYKWIVLGALCLAGMGIIIAPLFMSGKNKDEPTEVVKEDSYTVGGIAGKPYIAPPPPVPPAPPPPQQTVMQTMGGVSTQEDLLQQEAIRIARERRKQREEALQSKQIIYNKESSKGTPALGNVDPSGLIGGDDENLLFAARFGNVSGNTMVAGKIVNLSTTVPKGAMIDAILETSISSDLPGQARAIVADNVYSADGSHLLIAEGSTMLGQYSSGVQQGQTGIMLVWQTLRTPDGSEIQLDSMATSPLGRSGIAGEVDNHFAERFGSAIMFSFIEGAIQVGVNAASDPEAQQVAITSGQSTSRTAEVALENSINRRPTIIVHQGDRVRAFLRNALDMTPTVQKGSRFVP